MKRFTEKMVILCTPAQKKAAQRLAGGKMQVSQFIRFILMHTAATQQDQEAVEAFAGEFADGIKATIQKMIDESIDKNK